MDINSAMQTITREIMSIKTTYKAKPWISSTTLSLIEERNLQRVNGNITEEKQLSKLIKKQVRLDRDYWLETLINDGDWSSINCFRRSLKKKQIGGENANKLVVCLVPHPNRCLLLEVTEALVL